jgi:transcriptional regulator with XRE-family HTH domain
LDLTQAQLARALKVTQATVSDWEAGKHEPSPDNYVALGALAGEPYEGTFFWGKFPKIVSAHAKALRQLLNERSGSAGKSRQGGGRQTRLEPELIEQLHAALDLILERAPRTIVDDVANYLTDRAGKYGEER